MKLLSKIYILTLFVSIITIFLFLLFAWNEFEDNMNNNSWKETKYSNWNKQDSNILYTNITSINMNYKNNKNILNYFNGYYNDNINIKLLPFYSIFNKYAVFYVYNENNENNNINIVSQYEVLFYKKNTLNILDYPNKKNIVNKIIKQKKNIYNIYNKNNIIIGTTYINNIDNFNKKYNIYDINNNNQINITISNNNLKIDCNNEFIPLNVVLGVISYSLLDTINTYSINILAKTMFYSIISFIIITIILFIIKRRKNISNNTRVNNDTDITNDTGINNTNVCQV